MMTIREAATATLTALVLALMAASAAAKDAVKVGFIGPLTGGVSVNGIGGRNSADMEIIAAATHYCSATAIATVDTYHKFGFPVIVWGAVLPDITYRNKYPEVHRVNGTMINQNEVAAKFMTGLGFKTWVVIHDTTDYGKAHNQYFAKDLAGDGGK